MKTLFRSIVLLMLFFAIGSTASAQKKLYTPDWQSLRRVQTPEWLQKGKFGIYTHWGPYAVHAYGENTTWYSHSMYNEDGEARKHFEENFGKLTPEFGYKDLIPMFTAEKFDADEWAELFQKAGARWAGPVAEHHDGFAMWDTEWSEWNAANMGPKRDVVGELEAAVKKRDMKYVTAFHHAANWFFFPVHDKRFDTGDPANAGLYGQYHLPGEMRNQEFLDEWYGKIIEVIDNYSPDFIWFDFALDEIPEGYVKDFLAYYYNHAEEAGKEVVVTYKGHDLVPGSGVRDLELGQEPNLTYNEWITDNSVDDRGAWGWAKDLTFKTPNRLIDNLVDRISKNGYLLLNVGPKPDGTIPEGAKEVLLAMGEWLEINGEAIYETTPWMVAGEGPTNLGEASDIGFNESGVLYTKEDIRFTVNGDNLYATFLDWPGEKAHIKALRGTDPGEGEDEEEVDYGEVPSIVGKTLSIQFEEETYTLEFREDHEGIVTGGEAGDGMEFYYEQENEEIWIESEFEEFDAIYDGETLVFREWEDSPNYPGFYKEEIKRISMLGDGKDLDWSLTRDGLVVDLPDERPCDHAYVLKIERYHHPQLK
jgi:alpha-L-fucosidase